ncbi:aspartate aminotransferase family protein [Roseicitreum antarcticum]|uniref:Acetylornithine aminotransferase n=1 Tax=Roseicitreum antarcticum TaxID=564137 RepID=A0A1H2VLQ2_9RHOB|nr:aspartate aminotransferase family protein [Roseicitreum antarcticum]SDW68799.1 acetylornithine/N-succinyldiaminopimelate aminotransferase [Roseicitreum antarcticum]
MSVAIPSILPTYNRAPLRFERGEGSWLTTDDGARYLDFAAGIAVNALGHAHPELVAALTEQAQKLWHVSNLYEIPAQTKLADLLVKHTFADTVFFTNSGTEAAELGIKMVRKYWSENAEARSTILTFEGAFHGRSTGAIAASGSEKMTKGYGPLMPGFKVLPWGDMDALRAAMDGSVAAVMLETIQGEGGIRVLPNTYLRGLRDLCDETGALMVLDEVQCGMGRSGKLFAHQWSGVAPDIMMVAKGIGGGFPLGALLATQNAARGMTAGTHGSTYGGNPLACAVGARVMEIVTRPTFLAEVQRKSKLLTRHLNGLVTAHSHVFEEVRGKGLLLGLKCRVPVADVLEANYAQHLLAVPAADNVLRLLPPLNISDSDIFEGIARLDRAAATISKVEPA